MDLPFLLIWMYPEVKVLPKYENKATLLYCKVKLINFNLYYYTLFFETRFFKVFLQWCMFIRFEPLPKKINLALYFNFLKVNMSIYNN